MKKTMLILAFLLCIALPTYAYTIDGDTIIYEGVRGRITQTPHTLTDIKNEVEITVTSYFDTTEVLDIALGYYEPNAVPTTALYYNPHIVYEDKQAVCNEDMINWTTNPHIAYCWSINENTTEYELKWTKPFETGNLDLKTIYWTEERQEDYTDISHKFRKINYDYNGKNTWYVIEAVTFEPDETKTLKLNINVQPNSNGKSDIFIKRNSDTFQQAHQSGNYILCDPWYSVGLNYCRDLTVSNGKAGHQSYFNWTFSGNEQADFDDLRFVNSTCNATATALPYFLRNKTDSTWATFDVLLDGTQNISVYYGNASTSSASSVTDVWGADLEGYWTFDIGAGSTAVDISGNGHDGTLTNANWNVSGIKGGSVNMGNARTTVITVGDHADFEPANTLTMVAWVRRNASQVQYTRVFEKYYGAGSPYASWNLDLWDGAGSANRPSIALGNGGIWTTSYTQVLDDQVWYMLIGTYDGTNARKYINGSIEGSPVAHSQTLSYSAGDVTIGNRQGASAGVNQLEGWLDEIQFYSRNLSDTEISNMYALIEPTFSVGVEQSQGVVDNPPLWSGNSTTFPANYDASITTANITFANGSVTSIVNTTDVNITSNFSGSNATVNMGLISGNSLSGAYGFQELLGANTYFWYSIASNNNSQTNTSDTRIFTISKSNSLCTVYANGLSNNDHVTYPDTITVYGTTNNTEGIWALWSNSTNISHLNNTPTIYGVDYAFFKSNVTASDNYTADDDDFVAIYIDQGNLTTNSNITFNTSNPVTQYSSVNVTCNYPIGIAQTDFKLYNDTAEIGNTTAIFNASTLGVMNFTCNSTGNINWTSGSVINDLTISTLGGIFINAVYDENTLTPLTFNLTIYNDTQSVTVNDITSYNNNTITGDMTIAISKIGYVARDYYADIPANETYNLTGYLLQTGDGSYITYWAYSSTSPTGELDALVNVTRFVGSGWVSVEQSLSDFEGKGTLFLSPYAVYRVNASKSGVGYVYISSYSANPSVLLRLDMGGTGNATSISWLFTDVNYSLTPTNAFIRNSSDNLTLFNYTIAVGDADLEYYGMNITLADGTNIYSNNTTGASGGTVTVNFNMTGREGQTINVRTWFKKADYDVWIWDRGYIVVENHSYIPDLFGAFVSGGSAGLSSIAGQLIALFLSIASAGMGKKITTAGSSILFLLALSVFTFIGFFNWSIFLLLGFVGLIIIAGDKWR